MLGGLGSKDQQEGTWKRMAGASAGLFRVLMRPPVTRTSHDGNVDQNTSLDGGSTSLFGLR